jgi:hypothetical protein
MCQGVCHKPLGPWGEHRAGRAVMGVSQGEASDQHGKRYAPGACISWRVPGGRRYAAYVVHTEPSCRGLDAQGGTGACHPARLVVPYRLLAVG